MFVIRYHDRVNDLQVSSPKDRGPFDRAEWFALLEESGLMPLIAKAEDKYGSVALPLIRTNDRLEPLRNWYSFTWRPVYDGDVSNDLLARLADDLRGKSHRVMMWPVPDEDRSATLLAAAFRTAGWSVSMKQCDHNHVLPVAGRSFAEYWAHRPGRLRTTLKRKAKKVNVELLTRYDAAIWAEYEAIYAESWKPDEGSPHLLRKFAEAEGAAGRIRMAVARFDGTAVAAQFWTVENSVAYIHKLAHSEAHTALSAGTTLSAALFEQVIDRDGVKLVDFGTGNDHYKADWMELVRPRYRIDCLDPRQSRAWVPLAKRVLSTAMERLASLRPRR